MTWNQTNSQDFNQLCCSYGVCNGHEF